MALPAHAPLTLLASVQLPDAALLLLLLLFCAWGAMRGTLRQLLSIFVLGAALYAACRVAPRLAATAAKVTGLQPAESVAAAWVAVLFSGLVLGAIVAAFVAHGLPARSRGVWDRVLGGGLGLVKGAFVLVIVSYALLGGTPGLPAPALSRSDAHEASGTEAEPSWVDAVRGTVSARCMATGARLLERWFALPGWIRDRVRDVNRRLEVRVPPAERGPGRRPRGT